MKAQMDDMTQEIISLRQYITQNLSRERQESRAALPEGFDFPISNVPEMTQLDMACQDPKVADQFVSYMIITITILLLIL